MKLRLCILLLISPIYSMQHQSTSSDQTAHSSQVSTITMPKEIIAEIYAYKVLFTCDDSRNIKKAKEYCESLWGNKNELTDRMKNYEIQAVFRECGLNPFPLNEFSDVNKWKFALLRHAIVAGKSSLEPLVKTLLSCGTNPNNTDWQEQTPLHMAVTTKNPSEWLVTSLLASQCDANHQDNASDTALHLAVSKCHEMYQNKRAENGKNIANIEAIIDALLPVTDLGLMNLLKNTVLDITLAGSAPLRIKLRVLFYSGHILEKAFGNKSSIVASFLETSHINGSDNKIIENELMACKKEMEKRKRYLQEIKTRKKID